MTAEFTRRQRATRWAAVLIPGLVIAFVPVAGLTSPQSHLLGVFVATIIALVAHPVPMGVSAVCAMALLAITGTVEPARALSGFSDLTVWLVFCAFLFARAVTVTRFGARVAYATIHAFGRSPLALGYSVAVADVALAPFVPSDTARGGGIMAPITRSIAVAAGSEPGDTARVLGAFLMLVGFHATYTASSMFLTGMAANPLISSFAEKATGTPITWVRWALGASVPGICTLIVVPWLIYKLVPPTLADTRSARAHAASELHALGSMSRNEWALVVVLALVMAAWVTSPLHKIPNAIVALAGVAALLLLNVMSWDDLLGERRAWDALVWFAPLLMMASELSRTGVITALSGSLLGQLHGWPWPLALLVLAVTYLYLHYGFASMTAHVTALYPGFLATALIAGVPVALAPMPLAYFSSLDASLTHYGTGSAPIYFGAGYVSQGTWWRVGFLVSLVNIVIWLGVGMVWWKVLGWW